MKWNDLTVIIFLAIQQACAVQEHVEPFLKVGNKGLLEATIELEPIPHQQIFNVAAVSSDEYEPKDNFSFYSTLNNDDTPLEERKMIKVIRMSDLQDNNDAQATLLKKRNENFPKPTKPAGAPDVVPTGNTIYPGKHITHPAGGGGSIAHSAETAAHSATSTAGRTKMFHGKTGKAVVGVALATAALGGLAGIVALKQHQQSKNMKRQEPESIQPFEKRNKIPKGKAAAIFAGGAAVGGLGMHIYHGSGKPPAAEPKTESTPPPPAE